MAQFLYPPSSAAIAAGAATEAKQDSQITELQGINTELDGQSTTLTSLDGKILENLIDSNNSTTATLGAGATFTGTGTDVSKYAAVAITIFADQDSAVDGMQFQFSSDNTNWDEVNSYNLDISVSQTRRFQFPVTAQYFRFVYTNGATPQGTFRVQTIVHTTNVLTSIHRINTGLTNDRSVTVTKSVIAGETSAGGGAFVNVKANPSGSLEVNSNQTTHDDLNANANIQVGDIDVSGANPVPISATSLPLPTGAATEATLASIDSKDFATQTTLAALLTELQLKADLTETQPVSATTLPLPTGAATEATLASINGKDFATQTTLASIDAKDFATQTTLAALLVELQGKADLIETQPVSAASLPLPTGAATEATLASIDAKDFATQTTLAALLTELQGKADLTETQPVSAASLPLPTGAATEATLSTLTGKDFATQTTLAALLTELQLKADLTETQPVSAASLPLPTGAATEATLSTLNGKVTAVDTGNVTISAALPTGTNTIGAVDVNTLTPVDFLDSGLVDAAGTNIATTGTTVVASLAADCKELEIVEDIGEFMTIRNGADAILAYLPLGGGRVKVSISSGTAIKLTSETGSAITTGSIAINFLG